MRKHAFFAAVLAAAWAVSASETTSSQAVAAANAWAAANAQSFAPSGSAVEAVAERDGSGALLWWTVPFSGGGAVIVAPDTRIEPVMVALPSYSGSLPAGHPLRTMLLLDITNRLAQVKNVPEASSGVRRLKSAGGAATSSANADVVASATAANAKWSSLAPSGPVRLKAKPTYPLPITGSGNPSYVIGTCFGFEYGGIYTHWGQNSRSPSLTPAPYSTEPDYNCYNYSTPRHAQAGCEAVVGAAILQHYGITGPTYNATNECSWGEETMLNERYWADFTMIGATNAYDWSILPESMGGKVRLDGVYLTKEQVELLGLVIYDMGVALGMAWDCDGAGSAALMVKLADAFREYYGFKDARAVIMPEVPDKDDMKYFTALAEPYESMYTNYNEKLLYSQLRNNVPVVLSLATFVDGELGGDEAVVAVGYGRDNLGTSYTRIFMGASGKGDAWYCLPEVGSYRFVNSFVSMIGKEDRKTVPIVGRVTNTSGQGAAYAEVNVGGLTNVNADANGFWATRIDTEGLSLAPGYTNLWNVAVLTNSCPVDDESGVADIVATIKYYEDMTNWVYDAKFGDERVEAAYKITFVSETNEVEVVQEDDSVVNCLQLIVTKKCDARVCYVPVTCVATGEKIDVPVGAVAFGIMEVETDEEENPLYDEEGMVSYKEKVRYKEKYDKEDIMKSDVSAVALADSIPGEVSFTVPDDKAIVAWSSATNPKVVATYAAEHGKMMFILSGYPDTAEYKAIMDYLQQNAEEFNEKYVLLIINPDNDPYTMLDANPSFGAFDPDIFNSQDENRWAFFNGRISYFNASNGVTDDDVRRVLDEGRISYEKLHSDIRVTVRANQCTTFDEYHRRTSEDDRPYFDWLSELWGQGFDPNNEDFKVDTSDWQGQCLTGLREYVSCFTNGQTAVFSAPSVVTNGNVVWASVGWVACNTNDVYVTNIDGHVVEWKAGTLHYGWNLGTGAFWPFEEMPEVFDLSEFGFTWYMSDTNNPSSFTNAVLPLSEGDDLQLTWYWRPVEVLIDVTVENGTVTPDAGWYPFSFSTNEEDMVTVEFTASPAEAGATFLGWRDAPDYADAGSPTIQVRTDQPLSFSSAFSTDNNTYRLSFANDPSSVSSTTEVKINGENKKFSNNALTSKPGYVVASNTVESVEVDGKTLYCAGWTATGSAPAHGTGNVCEFALTQRTAITWLWRGEGWVDPYDDAAITFTVDAGEGAPEGEPSPAAGTYVNAYTNGQTVICSATPGITNTVDSVAVVCAGWVLTDNLSGDEVASGSGAEAEITFEKNADWTLTWSWKTNELVRIVVRVENGTASVPETDYYQKGEVVDVTVTAQNAFVFDHWEGDTNGCVFAGYRLVPGYTASIPADQDREITAFFANNGIANSYPSLTVKSVCTNDANGVEVDWGAPNPGYMDRESGIAAGGQMIFNMDDAVKTNIVGDVTNIWVCSGWKVFGCYTNLLADESLLLAEGKGTTATFRFTCESTLLWVWTGPASERSPLPDTLEGPDGTLPLTVSATSAIARVANTAAGWWYGLYSKTSLTDPNEKWTLVPGKAALATADNELIELEIIWDPAEPAKFFKIIITEEDPR